MLNHSMKNLTLVIPAKYEKITLPKVLNELEKFNVSKIKKRRSLVKYIEVPQYGTLLRHFS